MGPLAGLKIVEFAGIGPGPFCAMMLADMGAEVLRIDKPDSKSDDRDQYRYKLLNRGRRSVILDLKRPEGVSTALHLIERADALIEGNRPGVMERLGLGPETCATHNPQLVYGRMTGWGQNGPLAQSAGHDINYISLTGALWSIGRKGEAPTPPLNLVGDLGGGAMYLAFGIACALIEARRSGRGQVVDAAMVDGASSLMTWAFGLHAAGKWSYVRGDNLLDTGCPWYDVYETADGRHISVGPLEPQFYEQLLDLLDLNPLELPERNDRSRWPELRAAFAARFKCEDFATWRELLEGTDCCAAPVLSPDEAVTHRHLIARKTFAEIDGILQPAPAPRFSRSAPDLPRPPRRAGADTHDALASWGIAPDEIERLCALGTAMQS
jgi:alpha-methylacyl-CoA racemase